MSHALHLMDLSLITVRAKYPYRLLISMLRIMPILFLLLFPLIEVIAQTCCPGGVPLSTNLGLPPGDKGTWQFNLYFDQNVLRTLKEGSNELRDNYRERITRSILTEVSYGFTERIVADVLMSYVNQ